MTTPIARPYVVTVHDPEADLTEVFETWQANKVDAIDYARHIYGPCFGARTTYAADRRSLTWAEKRSAELDRSGR